MTVRFGEEIKVELYGTSHGPCIGVRIEGLPEGISIDRQKLQEFLDRRAPGRNDWSTPRKEADRPQFLEGTRPADGEEAENPNKLITTGQILTAQIPNTNVRPQDYRNSSVVPRPGHADYPAWVKYGRIESGGGAFSARLTAALCIAGGIAMQQLDRRGIRIGAHIASIGGVHDAPYDPMTGTGAPGSAADLPEISRDFPVIEPARGESMKEEIARVKADGDSIGGSIECMILGVPAGTGSPLFGNIESRICQAVFAVPAVKGIEFGAGFQTAGLKGSENNDAYEITGDGSVRTRTNRHGGILGGLASGMPVCFRVAMKPTPSIAGQQQSVDLTEKKPVPLLIKGRHDPCIVPRAVPCIEAAAALAIYDLLLEEDQEKR